MTALTEDQQALLDATERLLAAIAAGDWKTYAELVDPSITCFEPEAAMQLVEGLPFHHYYFEHGAPPAAKPQNTLARPHVRALGDAGVVSYVRLTQRFGAEGHKTIAAEETRVWQRRGGVWRMVHFHRGTPKAI